MPEDIWYYAKSGQQIGPVSRPQLEQLVAASQVLPGDYVWTQGMPQWEPAGKIFAAYLSATPVAPPMPPPGAMSYYSGAYPPTYPYAGFWRRFAAWFIDWLITLVLSFVAAGCLGGCIGAILSGQHATQAEIQSQIKSMEGWFQLEALIVAWLYYSLMESSSRQATIGKSTMGLIVTDTQGQRITFLRASARFFGKFLSVLLLTIGFLMIPFTTRKQALHDLMANTLVMNPRA